MTAPKAPPSSGWRSVFAVPDYRRLWAIGVVSSVVRWLDTLAFAVFAYQATGSASVVALLTMLRLVPMALIGPFLGALGERIERRTMLFAVSCLMCATALVLAWLAHAGVLAVWHLAVAALLNGLAWATDNTVRRLLIGEVVGSARVGAAMSIDIGSGNAARLLGPTTGGALLAGVGIEGAFLLGAVLYLVPIVAAWRLAWRSAGAPAGGPAILARIAEGFAVVRRDRRLAGTMAVTVIFNLFGWPFTSMVPVIATDALGLGPRGAGLLAGLDGLGSLASAALLAVWLRPRHYRAAYVGGTAAYLATLSLFALSPDPVTAGVVLVINGFAQSGFGVMQSTLVYVLAPPEARSRVFGVLSMCIGTAPLGFIQLGLLADAIGAPYATALIGVQGLLALALTWRLWRTI
jgi:MFS family permease